MVLVLICVIAIPIARLGPENVMLAKQIPIMSVEVPRVNNVKSSIAAVKHIVIQGVTLVRDVAVGRVKIAKLRISVLEDLVVPRVIVVSDNFHQVG
jgi:hypothetical protein